LISPALSSTLMASMNLAATPGFPSATRPRDSSAHHHLKLQLARTTTSFGYFSAFRSSPSSLTSPFLAPPLRQRSLSPARRRRALASASLQLTGYPREFPASWFQSRRFSVPPQSPTMDAHDGMRGRTELDVWSGCMTRA
jgi:hypothetical protein